MDVALFDYNLPPELIAQEPLADRGQSRMLVMPRTGDLSLADRHFHDLPEYLRPGDCLVLNDTRVIPARLTGRRATGGKVEVLLLRASADSTWEALVRPGARLRLGTRIAFGDGALEVEIVGMATGGLRTVRLHHDGELLPLLERLGQTPLPPYIHRDAPRDADRQRYQTVYAARPGAVAAPTAGLHFDLPALDALRAGGISTVTVTLHVGLGTFQPVTAATVEGHEMHEEWCEVTPEAAAAIHATRAGGGRIVAIGTTTVRALESRAQADGSLAAGAGLTRLFITPGYEFRLVDALLTNFHLPRSTLLMMISAFAGRDRVLAAYHHAIANRYRFYSYGDCMFIH